MLFFFSTVLRAVVVQEHKCVTVNATGCGLNPHSRKWNIYWNFYFISSLWCRRWDPSFNTQCLNSAENRERSLTTKFPLPTLQCAGYSVKLLLLNINIINKLTQHTLYLKKMYIYYALYLLLLLLGVYNWNRVQCYLHLVNVCVLYILVIVCSFNI